MTKTPKYAIICRGTEGGYQLAVTDISMTVCTKKVPYEEARDFISRGLAKLGLNEENWKEQIEKALRVDKEHTRIAHDTGVVVEIGYDHKEVILEGEQEQ